MIPAPGGDIVITVNGVTPFGESVNVPNDGEFHEFPFTSGELDSILANSFVAVTSEIGGGTLTMKFVD